MFFRLGMPILKQPLALLESIAKLALAVCEVADRWNKKKGGRK